MYVGPLLDLSLRDLSAEIYRLKIAGEHARRVERVLDVRQGELCWVAGTVFMDMPLKPNILDDLSKEVKFLFPPFPLSHSY